MTDYENGRLRLTAEMAVRFAMALEVSLDELLHPKLPQHAARQPSRKVLRRLKQIETPPRPQQATVLKSIDIMLRGLRIAS